MAFKVFDWHCSECGNEQERITRSTDQHLECPECGGRMHRLPPVVAGRVKGIKATCSQSQNYKEIDA